MKRYTSGNSSAEASRGLLDSCEYQVERKKKKKSQPSSHAAIRIVDHDEEIKIKNRSEDVDQHRTMKRGRDDADDNDERESHMDCTLLSQCPDLSLFFPQCPQSSQ